MCIVCPSLFQMSTKVKRKVTVENSKESDEPRRPSVFERLGPGAANVAPQPAEVIRIFLSIFFNVIMHMYIVCYKWSLKYWNNQEKLDLFNDCYRLEIYAV